MEIINSLKRLERAGAENSRTTEKLRQGAAQVADLICEVAPADLGVKGYHIVVAPFHRFLALGEGEKETYVSISCSGYLPPRETALAFAKDVANGLLDEIAERVEMDASEASEGLAVLRAASEAVKKAKESRDAALRSE